MVRLMCFAEY